MWQQEVTASCQHLLLLLPLTCRGHESGMCRPPPCAAAAGRTPQRQTSTEQQAAHGQARSHC